MGNAVAADQSGCSGHEIIGDPCGEETADHEKGVSTSKEVKSSENWKLEIEKEKKDPVIDESILPDLF